MHPMRVTLVQALRGIWGSFLLSSGWQCVEATGLLGTLDLDLGLWRAERAEEGSRGLGQRASRLQGRCVPWVWVSHTGCPWCSEAMVSVLRKTSSSTAQ